MSSGQNFDVLVVGGGMAGLCAGTRAAELGLSVAVFEKGETPQYVNNARVSGGTFHVAHTDILKPKEELLAAINHSTHGHADPALAATLAARSKPMYEWLVGLGAKFLRVPTQAYGAPISAPPRPLAQSDDWMNSWQGRGPDLLMRVLTEKLVKSGGKLILGAQVQKLRMSGERCVGLEAVIGGATKQFDGVAVVLADGGFQANLELLKGNISPMPERVKQRNTRTGVGDGLRMAQAAGAALTALSGFYGHILSRDALTNERLWPYPLLDDLAASGIVVNGQGRRFCDEDGGGVYIANMIAGSADPAGNSVICDATAWDAAGQKAHVNSPNPKLARLGGTIHKADTLAGLAAAAGVPADALAATVSAFNQACRAGALATLDPPRSTSHNQPVAIEKAPFYAIPACAGITFTMGGIKIDGDARVLRQDGGAIAGLYAAGSTAGGLENGGGRAGYVSGLTKAAVFGKHAAEHIAQQRDGARLTGPTRHKLHL